MTRSRIRRRVLLVVLALPLLTTGTCLDIAQESLIDGFFDAVTPHLVDQAEEGLGLTSDASDTAETS